MKKYILTFFLNALMNCYSIGQTSVADSCFSSCTPATTFISSADLQNTMDADLMEWNGLNWLGSWPNANITIPPPSQQLNCRAIFIGNGVTWTYGGEAFGIRLNQPLIMGQLYSLSFTYVSHGYGSDGHFCPKIFSNSTSQIFGAVLIDSLTPAGYNWKTSNFIFTANSNQNGHSWIIVSTDTSISSGIVSSFCKTCSYIAENTVINSPDASNSTSMIFPNPFSNELNVKLAGNRLLQIILYDITSREILRQEFTDVASLNTENISKGIYLYELRSKNELLKIGKLVKD